MSLEATHQQASDPPSVRSGGLSPLLIGVIVLLALAPLPFGSVAPLWKNVLASASLSLFVLFVISRRTTLTWPPHGMTSLTWAAALFVGVCVWIWVQTWSITPDTWHHPAWLIASQALNTPVTGSISINPAATLTDLLSLLGVAAVFAIVLYEARTPLQARRLLAALALIAFAYALYGLIIFLSGNGWVAWAPKRHYTDALSSTLVNRNSYGVFAGLGIACATALLASALAPMVAGRMRQKERLSRTLSYLAGRGGFWLLAILLGISALLLTGSRAASAASFVGLAALLTLYLGARRAGTATLVIGALIAVTIGALFVDLSGDLLIERIETAGKSTSVRLEIYDLLYIAIPDHFWLGAGYGAFEDAFRLYAGLFKELGPNFHAAHSIYLEAAFELGVPAAVALFASVGICVVLCARAITIRRRDRVFPALALAATLIVGLQGLIDFAVQTPSISAFYAAILGIGVAQATSRTNTKG